MARELDEVGRCAMASLREMVAALECDYDRLEELREAFEDWKELGEDNGEIASGVRPTLEIKDWALCDEDGEEILALIDAAGECKDRDEAEQRIHEDPLSIEYRTGWMTQRDTVERDDWAECRILLTTGGPAVQIMVELTDGEPHRAYLQVQDWGTPWTDYYESGIGETLMAYVRCFCFE